MSKQSKISFLLDTAVSEPLYLQLYRQIRQCILSGDWPPGMKLPPSRQLAQTSGIARLTVARAYAQLKTEGFVVARQGAGTYVANLPLPERGTAVSAPPVFTPRLTPWAERVLAAAAGSSRAVPRPEIDFGFGRSFPHIFPYDTWRRLLARYLSTDDAMLSRYGSVAGFYPLRAALAEHLAQWRDLTCTPEDIVIVNGAQQALDILARLLLTPGDEVLVETPGYADAATLFRLHGAALTAVAVDNAGFPVEHIPTGSRARLAFVTPSNQFPRGGVMPLSRRLALLRWAQMNQAFIIEDDYDGELRYDGRPLSALQSLDTTGHVIYLGTFSKVLFPALRLAYVVLPPTLVTPFVQAKGLVDRGAPTLTQAAVADFISEGHFDLHLRHLRQAYGERRQALTAALDNYLAGQVRYVSEPAGLHIMVELPPGVDEAGAIARAQAAGVGIYPAAPYFIHPGPPAILMGFSGLTSADIVEGVARLASVLLPPAAEK